MKIKNVLTTGLIVGFTSMLMACGGGSSSSPTTSEAEATPPVTPPAPVEPTTYTGVFIDSAVEGLNYKTATQEGATGSNGEFIYQLGETITFSIGGIDFPAVAVKSEITPLDVFNTQDIESVGVVNMLRLLQSLDSDGMPENGITLREEIHTLAANIDVNFTDSNFDVVVNGALALYEGINSSLISQETAVQHFRDTLMLNQPNPSGCGDDHAKVGYSGSFSTLFYNVSGTATIIDNCTIRITGFNYEANAAVPGPYFYGSTSDQYPASSSFTIGDILRSNNVPYVNQDITLKLPNNVTLDDIDYLSVWCVPVRANFGDLRFQAP